MKLAIKQNYFGSAYLFSGPRGVGKTTLARVFSNTILCDSPVNGNPCGVCESCLLFLGDSHFGYKELDAASYGGKEDMVRLRDDASSLAVTKKKIILLDESHDISKSGQDSLLKQIEECPEHLIYIFCTTDPDKMSLTLRDRCTPFQITRIDAYLIIPRLKLICEKEHLKYENEALEIIAVRSEGHVRNAINLLELVAYIGDITIDNFKKISTDYEEEVFIIVSNLGIDIVKVISTYRAISSYLSEFEFYNLLLSLINDAVKLFYGYDDFIEKRKKLLSKLKEIHGSSLLGFLDYLISRDKFVDKIGLESDLLVLHYKFNANSFKPQIPVQKHSISQNAPQKEKKEESIPFHVKDITKMEPKERSEILRKQRKNQKIKEEEPEIVPSNWPLPKEERRGEGSYVEEFSPLEFSQKLVGGRGGEMQKVVDSRIE